MVSIVAQPQRYIQIHTDNRTRTVGGMILSFGREVRTFDVDRIEQGDAYADGEKAVRHLKVSGDMWPSDCRTVDDKPIGSFEFDTHTDMGNGKYSDNHVSVVSGIDSCGKVDITFYHDGFRPDGVQMWRKFVTTTTEIVTGIKNANYAYTDQEYQRVYTDWRGAHDVSKSSRTYERRMYTIKARHGDVRRSLNTVTEIVGDCF